LRGRLRVCKEKEPKELDQMAVSTSEISRMQGSTDANYDNPRSYVEHNHPADRTGVEVTKLQATMKAQAKQSTSCPHQILTQYLLQANDDVCANVGNLETCKRDLRRQRRGCLPKAPEEWKTTRGANPRPFLVHDSGPDAGQHVVLYSAEEQLRHLGQADTWYMDGNFAMSPNIFEQLYVIQAFLGETTVSCFYTFLLGKSSQVYQEMLHAVVHKMEELLIFPDPGSLLPTLSWQQYSQYLQYLYHTSLRRVASITSVKVPGGKYRNWG